MLRHRISYGALVLFLLLSVDAAACRNDRDCPAASRCVISSFGGDEGVCQHGVEPVQGDPRRSIGDREGRTLDQGETCEFTVDCRQGLTCERVENSSLRTCQR